MRWGWLVSSYPACLVHRWLLPTWLAPYTPLPLIKALATAYFVCDTTSPGFSGFLAGEQGPPGRVFGWVWTTVPWGPLPASGIPRAPPVQLA